MSCRVGITTNPEERKRYWQNRVNGFRAWNIIGQYPTKDQAQQHEDNYARQSGCEAHAGGPDTPGTWYVYTFQFTSPK